MKAIRIVIQLYELEDSPSCFDARYVFSIEGKLVFEHLAKRFHHGVVAGKALLLDQVTAFRYCSSAKWVLLQVAV